MIRAGFEWILDCVCQGSAGAIFSTEASRLARNGREWHSLLEFCAVVNTLIIDEEGIYDPKSTNDRLLLGMKGAMSEMELTRYRGQVFLFASLPSIIDFHGQAPTHRIYRRTVPRYLSRRRAGSHLSGRRRQRAVYGCAGGMLAKYITGWPIPGA